MADIIEHPLMERGLKRVFILIREKLDALKNKTEEDLNTKYDKTGGTISGDVTIEGNTYMNDWVWVQRSNGNLSLKYVGTDEEE